MNNDYPRVTVQIGRDAIPLTDPVFREAVIPSDIGMERIERTLTGYTGMLLDALLGDFDQPLCIDIQLGVDSHIRRGYARVTSLTVVFHRTRPRRAFEFMFIGDLVDVGARVQTGN